MSAVDVELKTSHSAHSFDKYQLCADQDVHANKGNKNTTIQAPGPGEPLVVVEGTIPKTPPKGVVVKVHCTGICHSDVHIWCDKVKVTEDLVFTMQQLNPGFQWPFILGHEIAREVHSMGDECSDSTLAVGDRVVVYPWVGCGTCGPCTHGDSNLCALSIAYDVGVGVPGGYQCYVAIADHSNILKLADDVSAEVACMFGCSALTAYNVCLRVQRSVERAIRFSGKANFLIVGAGGLGLWTLQMAKAILPEGTKVFMADIDEEKLKQAKAQGADEIVLWSRGEDEQVLVEKTKELTGGIDAAVDFVGVTATVNRAFQAANKGSTLAVVGLAGGTANVSLVQLALKDITLTGVYVGNRGQVAELIELYKQKKIKSPPLIHVKPDETPKAIQKLKEGKVNGRSIIHFV